MKSQKTKAKDAIKVGFESDLMFAMVMQDPALCKRVLQRIMPNRKIGEVRLIVEDIDEDENENKFKNMEEALLKNMEAKLEGDSEVTTQKTFTNGLWSKGVRLDVFMEDEGCWYDIEMQRDNLTNIPIRSRYYHSTMDMNMIGPGDDYEELKHSMVVFICTFDLFKKNMPIYQFENICVDDLNLKLGDKKSTIIVNTKATKNVDEDLQKFFDYINDHKVATDDDLIRDIDAKVAYYNQGEWGKMIMTLEEKMQENIRKGEKIGKEEGIAIGKEEGIAIGKEEGIAIGKEEGVEIGKETEKIKIAKAMKADNASTENIMKYTGLPQEAIEKL